MTQRTPPLAEVLFLLHDQRAADVHVAVPGKVTRVDAAKGLVDVKPLLQGWNVDATGARVPAPLQVVPNVPVVWPGGGGFRATFPIAVGDTVLLVFADRSMDRWKSLDGDVDPMSYNAHALTDAVCIPGLRSFKNPLATNPTDRATFGSDGGSARVEALPARINLWAGASQAFVLGGQYQSHMTSLQTAMTNLSIALNALNAAVTPLMLPPAAAAAKAAIVLAKTAVDSAVTAAGNLAADISSNVFGA